MRILSFKIAAFGVVFLTGLLGGALSGWLAGSRKSETSFLAGMPSQAVSFSWPG